MFVPSLSWQNVPFIYINGSNGERTVRRAQLPNKRRVREVRSVAKANRPAGKRGDSEVEGHARAGPVPAVAFPGAASAAALIRHAPDIVHKRRHAKLVKEESGVSDAPAVGVKRRVVVGRPGVCDGGQLERLHQLVRQRHAVPTALSPERERERTHSDVR
jgi:hypothetical protein